MPRDPELGRYVQRLAIAIGALALLAVAWIAREVLVVLFAAMLFAVFISWLAKGLGRITRLPRGPASFIVGTVILGLAVGLAARWGSSSVGALDSTVAALREQLAPWMERLPDRARDALERSVLGADADAAGVVGDLMRWAGHGLTFVFVGLFVAARPELYREGALALVPRTRRRWAAKLLDELVRTLGRFLVARAVAMILVGLGSALAFWLADVPLAVPLAVLASVLTFVPYFGPIVATLPIALLSLAEGLDAFLIATGSYVAIQLITGYVGDPLLQQRLVAIPAALVLASQVLLGVLVGPLGVAFGAPLMVVVLVIGRALGPGGEARQ